MTGFSTAMKGPPTARSSLCDGLAAYPCAALAFDEDGHLVASNQRANDLYVGMDSNSMKMSKLADKVEVSGQTLSAADLRELMENSTSVQYLQPVQQNGDCQWLLCQASKVAVPGQDNRLTMLVQLDITEAKKRLIELEQAESCLREQMQALQRKLVRTVTENEALLHVVDKLQFSVLALRRQLHRAGLTPDVVVDDALLRLAPHQDIYAAMIAGLGISGSDGHADDLAELTNFSTQGDASWPVQLSPGHKATSRAKLLHNQISVEAAAYRAKYEKFEKAAADESSLKAGYDKLTVDASELKAGYDKLIVDSALQQCHLDKAAADAADFKAGYDKLLVNDHDQHAQLDKAAADAAEYKAGFDKLMVDNAEQQAQLDKAAVDAAEFKAGYDKLLVDSAEQKAQYDLEASVQHAYAEKLTADAAELKAGYDKYSADAAEYKAGFDKYAADAAEYKAGYDKLLVDNTEQKAQYDKCAADAAEYKAGFDKLTVDNFEQQAQMDKACADAAEYKAGYDKLLVDSTEEKAQYDQEAAAQHAYVQKLTADAAELKFGYDKYAADASEYKAGFDKLTADNIEQQAHVDKLTADAAEYKAGYDKLLVDTAEQQAFVDKLNVDAAEFKAGYDKLLVDSAEQQAVIDKAEADATEMKAGFDKLIVDSAEQKAQFDKAAVDAAEYKAGFDKLFVDSVEQKAQYDKATADAAEYKAGFDKLMVDTAEQQAQIDKATADAAEFKAGFDKLLVDSAEHKAQLDKATADAADYKAGFDKLLVDTTEQKAQLDKASADAFEYKAGFDKLLVDSAEQKAQLDKAAADATEYKAGYDKYAADAAEYKAGYDKYAADAAEYKAGFDKLTVDGAEQKAQLDKVTADAAEYKAGFDKAAADATEYKSGLDKITADAAEYKAGFDKLVVDSAEQKAQLDKATADALEYEAGFNKVTADAAEYKAGFDKAMADGVEQQAQLDKLSADAAELKAGFDKMAVDSNEQKAQLDKATADAAEYKAGFDKAAADAAEFKAGYDKVSGDAAEFKAGCDKATADSAEYKSQMGKMAEEMSLVQEQLVKERENFSALHDQHAQLLRQQEVLAAELMVTLGNYKPKANIDSGTPADKLLQMITDLLDGTLPNLEDILLIQSSILEARDIYQPWRLGKQLLETKDLEESVGASLVYLLTLQQQAQAPQPVSLQDLCGRNNNGNNNKHTPSVCPDTSSPELEQAAGEVGLQGMLNSICAPVTSQGLGMRPGRQVGNRRRSSSMSARLAAMPDIHESPVEDCLTPEQCQESQPLGPPRASQLLQQMALRRAGEQQPVNLRQLSTTGGPAGVGASAAAMLHHYTSSCQTGGASCGSTSSEDIEQSTDEDDDSSSSGSAGNPSESACGSQVAAGDVASAMSLKVNRPQAPVVMDQLEAVLASAYDWQFDAFALNEASQGHPLSTLGYYLFHKQGLLEHFNLKPRNLARFLRRMEEGYRQNPYHNAMHAADVLQTFHVIINRGGMVPGYVDPLHMMACYSAAVMHDFEHGGLTNDFLVNSLDNLAVRYNDRSPLENHHLAAAFTIMRTSDYNFIGSLPKAEFEKFRKIVIELVLATDMKQHFSILSHFTTVHRLNGGGGVTPGTSGSDPFITLNKSQRSQGSGSAGASIESETIILPLDDSERILGLQMALKCSDVGHVTAALPVHLKWVTQLEEEFFRQGDVERQNGMAISPLFDRSKQGITKSQVGFFDIVIIPLFHTFGKVFSNSRPLLTYVMRNYRYWSDMQAQAAQAEALSALEPSPSSVNSKTLSSPVRINTAGPSPLGFKKVVE